MVLVGISLAKGYKQELSTVRGCVSHKVPLGTVNPSRISDPSLGVVLCMLGATLDYRL